MKNTTRNLILILALSAVAIMSIGIFLYDYIPSGLTVTEASHYETSGATTEVLSEAKEAQEMLSATSQSTSTSPGTTSNSMQTNIVLKEYTITKGDIAMAKSIGEVEQGRPDPFAEVQAEDSSSGGSDSASSQVTTPNVPSDGSFYNSSKQK